MKIALGNVLAEKVVLMPNYLAGLCVLDVFIVAVASTADVALYLVHSTGLPEEFFPLLDAPEVRAAPPALIYPSRLHRLRYDDFGRNRHKIILTRLLTTFGTRTRMENFERCPTMTALHAAFIHTLSVPRHICRTFGRTVPSWTFDDLAISIRLWPNPLSLR